MSKRFAGKVAIITGAGRGLGRTIAEMFCAEGAHVMIAARTVSYGQQAVEHIRSLGGEASLCAVDVTRGGDIEKLVQDTVHAYGGVDMVIHCAAEFVPARITEATDEDIEKQLAAGIVAPFRLIRHAHPYLKRSGTGRIVFISSVEAVRTTVAGHAAYTAAKAGLNAFVRVAALELAPDGITVNGIEPGATATDRLVRKYGDEKLNAIGAAVPLSRIGTPEDIGHAAMFLCSHEAAYITAQMLTIDGGLSILGLDLLAIVSKVQTPAHAPTR